MLLRAGINAVAIEKYVSRWKRIGVDDVYLRHWCERDSDRYKLLTIEMNSDDRKRIVEVLGTLQADYDARAIEAALGLNGSQMEFKAISRLQAAQRGRIVRADLARQNAAATIIQAMERGRQGRQRIQRILCEIDAQ